MDQADLDLLNQFEATIDLSISSFYRDSFPHFIPTLDGEDGGLRVIVGALGDELPDKFFVPAYSSIDLAKNSSVLRNLGKKYTLIRIDDILAAINFWSLVLQAPLLQGKPCSLLLAFNMTEGAKNYPLCCLSCWLKDVADQVILTETKPLNQSQPEEEEGGPIEQTPE